MSKFDSASISDATTWDLKFELGEIGYWACIFPVWIIVNVMWFLPEPASLSLRLADWAEVVRDSRKGGMIWDLEARMAASWFGAHEVSWMEHSDFVLEPVTVADVAAPIKAVLYLYTQ